MSMSHKNFTKVCVSCKQPGHLRASHSDCPFNKKNKNLLVNQVPELINRNVIYLFFHFYFLFLAS